MSPPLSLMQLNERVVLVTYRILTVMTNKLQAKMILAACSRGNALRTESHVKNVLLVLASSRARGVTATLNVLGCLL